MTRINVVPVEELCDEHLRAEYREIVRVPKLVMKRKRFDHPIPPMNYTIRTEKNPEGGKGHVLFFYNKLLYLKKRFEQLTAEMQSRGFKTNFTWPAGCEMLCLACNDYEPTKQALELNRIRIKERKPKNPHYRGRKAI